LYFLKSGVQNWNKLRQQSVLLHFSYVRFKFMYFMAVDTSLLTRLHTSLHYWNNITFYAMGFDQINIVRNTDTYSEVLCRQTHSCTIDLRKKHTSSSSGFQIIVIFFKKKTWRKIRFLMSKKSLGLLTHQINLTDLVCCGDAER
jgi:hypothetical protein